MPKLDVALFLNFAAPHRFFEGQAEKLGFRAWVVGAQSGFRLGEALGVREFMVVRLSPIGAHLILRLPMSLIADRIVELDDLDSRLAGELTSAAYLARTWPERFRAVEAALARRIAHRQPPGLVMRAMQRITEQRGQLSLAGLAAELGCSHRHLIASFREQVGLAPKTVARISRFNAALAALYRECRVERGTGEPHLDLQPGPAPRKLNWADLATAHGYYDQAHFISECRGFCGLTPGQLLMSLQHDAAG